jgi:hypothetical protein
MEQWCPEQRSFIDLVSAFGKAASSGICGKKFLLYSVIRIMRTAMSHRACDPGRVDLVIVSEILSCRCVLTGP